MHPCTLSFFFFVALISTAVGADQDASADVRSALKALQERHIDDSGNRTDRQLNSGYLLTCKGMKAINPNAPSGTYIVTSSSNKRFEVYCEMGLNGGGYTFLSPRALSLLTNSEISQIFTDRSTFLMRVRRSDGTQPYAVLRQLPKYASIPLKLGLGESTGYSAPVNIKNLPSTFLYFGFLPIVNAANNEVQGFTMNGAPITFANCDKNPNSHITLFPNFSEYPPSTYNAGGGVCGKLFSNVLLNPSGRVMPPEYFMFAETHWGGCGCYIQTNQVPGVLGMNIGFR